MTMMMNLTSNLDEPKPLANERSTILGVIITFMILSWSCVIGRLYTRFKVVKAPGIDDLFVILYLLTTTAGSISACLSTQYGLGEHYSLLTNETRIAYHKTFYVMNGTYIMSTAFIKIALCCQYLRVFDRGTTAWTISLATAIFTGLWGFAYAFIAWVPCLPVSAFWAPDNNSHCWAYGNSRFNVPEFVATFESHTGINMTLDILILLLPTPLLFKKGTSFAQRMRLVGLLFMGSIVLFLAIWRLETIIRTQAATFPVPDPTWYAPLSIILSVLEADASSMCASLPIFWPVLTQQWDKMFVTVTQEVQITRESRYVDVDVHMQGNDAYAETLELTGDRRRSRLIGGAHQNHKPHHTHNNSSLSGSETDLKRAGSTGGGGKSHHYRDSYVLSHVDPLRSRGDSRAGAHVRSDSMKGGTSKYMPW